MGRRLKQQKNKRGSPLAAFPGEATPAFLPLLAILRLAGCLQGRDQMVDLEPSLLGTRNDDPKVDGLWPGLQVPGPPGIYSADGG